MGACVVELVHLRTLSGDEYETHPVWAPLQTRAVQELSPAVGVLGVDAESRCDAQRAEEDRGWGV